MDYSLKHRRVEPVTSEMISLCAGFLTNAPITPSTPRSTMSATTGFYTVRRALDVSLAMAMIVISAPLLVICTAVVRLSFKTSAIEWQLRSRFDGSTYRHYRFRTLGKSHDQGGQRLTDAERTAWFTGLIQFSGLAELPCLLSVLKGEISFFDKQARRSCFKGVAQNDMLYAPHRTKHHNFPRS